MKKIICIVLVVLMVISLLVGCGTASTTISTSANTTISTTKVTTQASSNTIVATTVNVPNVKIAHLGGFTGAYATYCALEKNSALMMQDIINNAGGIKSLGGAKIEFVFGDHMSDTSQIKTVLERTVADPNVVAIFHSSSSTFTVPMVGYAEKIGIPLLTINSALAITQSGYTYVFQDCFKAKEVGNAQVNFLLHLKDKYKLNTDKVGIVFQDNDSGRDGAVASKKLAESSGLSVVAYTAYPIGAPDMSSQVVTLMQSGAEAVFLNGDVNDLKQIISTMKSNKYNPLIIGGGAGFQIHDLAVSMGDNAIGVCTAGMPSFDSKHITENKKLQSLVDEFFKRYGFYPSTYEMGIISETLILVNALENCGSRDRTVIRDTLHKLEYTSMAVGTPTHYAADGSSDSIPAMVMQWQKMENGVVALRCVWPEEYCTAALNLDLMKK